jgi:predicted ATPase
MAAAAGDILMGSATTLQLVQEEVRENSGRQARASTIPLAARVYRVREVVQRRAGVPERHAQPRSPFVGRAHELAILHARLAQAERGQGQVVGITGEAGIGKSRLLAEFWRSVQGRQLIRLTGQCLPYGQMSPYLPVLTLLRQRCQITDADAAGTIRTKVYAAAQEAQIGSEEDIALLLQLLDIPVETGSPAHDSPHLHQAQIFALLRQMIVHSRPQPLLLVVEDVHWIDASSEAWLATVVQAWPTSPCCSWSRTGQGISRPGSGGHATQLAYRISLHMRSLRVVQAASPAASMPDHVQQAIITKAAGNPFFLEELTWSVLEQGNADAPLGVPDTVQGVLAARIDRLPPTAK